MKYYIYALIVLLLDQATKWIIVSQMALGEVRSVIGEFFFRSRHIGTAAPPLAFCRISAGFFIVITIGVAVGVIWYLQKTVKEGKKLLPFALSLLLGGALGQFYRSGVIR